MRCEDGEGGFSNEVTKSATGTKHEMPFHNLLLCGSNTNVNSCTKTEFIKISPRFTNASYFKAILIY